MGLGVRLGLNLNLCGSHACTCGQEVNARGTHSVAHKQCAGQHPWHALLNDVVWRALQRAEVPSTKEPNNLCRDGRRPDGVSMVPWSRGRCMAWDVTVPDTLAPSHIQATKASAGFAASSSEALKSAKYADLAATHTFIPLAFETLGSWGQRARHFVAELGRRTSAVTGDSRETAFLR